VKASSDGIAQCAVGGHCSPLCCGTWLQNVSTEHFSDIKH